jgi:hypothetical protein
LAHVKVSKQGFQTRSVVASSCTRSVHCINLTIGISLTTSKPYTIDEFPSVRLNGLAIAAGRHAIAATAAVRANFMFEIEAKKKRENERNEGFRRSNAR